MATKTVKKTANNEDVGEVLDEKQFNAQVSQTAESLIQDCSEVRLRINWFGTTAKVADDIAEEMMAPTEAERKAISISKRLMSGKHESIKALNEARQAIFAHLAAWTVPMLALRMSESSSATDVGSVRKDAGVRLIKKSDMQQFDDRLQYLIGILHTTVAALNEKLPEIKADDRIRLGRAFNDKDYPEDVTKLVNVEINYKNVSVDLDWEKLCPQIFERERNAAKAKFEKVVETAAAEYAARFVKYVSQVTDQLGCRMRLNPKEGFDKLTIVNADDTHGVVDIRDAEVLLILKHADEPEEIPADKVLVQVRLRKTTPGKSTDVWMAAPMAEQDYYTNLRPIETEERKKLYASSIANLRQELEAFRNIGSMLGPYQAKISDSVDTVLGLLRKGSEKLDSEQIAKELRSGTYFRNEFRSTLSLVRTSVQDTIVTATKMRRRIRTLETE